jgi:hypothetical protein
MAEITAKTSLQEVAAIISQALVAHGLEATLSGGAAVAGVPLGVRWALAAALSTPAACKP